MDIALAGYQNIQQITHGGVGETTPAPLGSATLRGWDVRTGKLLWTFHTIPYHWRGELRHLAQGVAYQEKAGGANSIDRRLPMDEKPGIVFAATGSGADDFYGSDHLGNNLYANSIIAINATTGKKIWHFQADPPRSLGCGFHLPADTVNLGAVMGR